MIGPGGTFDYEAVLGRDRCGRAVPAPGPGHPGSVGSRPTLAVADGVVIVRRTESVFARMNAHYQRWGQPASILTMQVGPLLASLAAHGDLLKVARHGTGDLSVELRREGQTLLGLGAIASEHHPSLDLEPPSDEDSDHIVGMAHCLDKPGSVSVWLDALDPNFDQRTRDLQLIECSRLLVSIAGPDEEARLTANRRISMGRLYPSMRSRWLCGVPTRFTTEDAWLAHLRALRDGPRLVRSVRFRLANEVIALRVGESAVRAPWLLHVARTETGGEPGSLHNVGIALEHEGVTLERLIESSEIAAGRRTVSSR